jgi:hypothetical protein
MDEKKPCGASLAPRNLRACRSRRVLVEQRKVVGDALDRATAFVDRFLRAVKIEQPQARKARRDQDFRRLA